MRNSTAILAAIVFCSCMPALGWSESLTIQDTSGFTRASGDLKEHSGQVDFTVEGSDGAPSNGDTITLINQSTGEKFTTTTFNGIASFKDITPGIWTVSSNAPGLVFTDIYVEGAALGAQTALAGLGVVGGATAAGGVALATGVVIAARRNNSSDSVLSPSE